MKKNIKELYDDLVANKFVIYNSKQIEALESISSTLNQHFKKTFFSKNKKIWGIYVWGSTGIGKTFILNLFVSNILNRKKYHFNHFMINLHAYINNAKNKEHALEFYIKELSKKYKLIFIDELHIFNIVDALLIKKIFFYLKKYKIFVLISSNFKPEDLYKNGLQRKDFLPFIEFIKENFEILYMNKIIDYRRDSLNQSKTFFTPVNEDTSREFNKLFERFVNKDEIHIRKINTKSRVIRIEKCTSNIAYFTFKKLCSENLGHEDYKNIANAFSIIFVDNVPHFSSSNSDECRRFISLIDMLYDHKRSVIILAEKPINQLCSINTLKKEFERTSSRLYEMTIIGNEKYNEKN